MPRPFELSIMARVETEKKSPSFSVLSRSGYVSLMEPETTMPKWVYPSGK